MNLVRSFLKDKLTVRIYENRADMGIAAAKDAARLLKSIISKQGGARVIFAAAPSQNEFLKKLSEETDIQWNKVTAFHMDEYIGLDKSAPQGFGNFLRERIFNRLPFAQVNYLDGEAADTDAECGRYAKLLNEKPIDIVFMGIGENGHIAFNDPPVADFNDRYTVKAVELDSICRNQQVNDGCFKSINQVPTHALTLTVPALAAAKYHLCMVPASTKANAVRAAVEDDISTACPASVLRRCENAVLYIERESAKLLREG